MVVIFLGSTGSFSAEATGAMVIPLLRVLLPSADLAHLQLLHAAVRKAGHLLEYAILAWLWCRSLAPMGHFPFLAYERQDHEDGAPADPGLLAQRSGRAAITVFAISLAYAALDELHQAWTGMRSGRVIDVLWDGTGAVAALGVLRFGWAGVERTRLGRRSEPPRASASP